MLRKTYIEELKEIKDEILDMSFRVEKMVGDAVEALTNQDTALARSLIASDDIIDEKEIALQQLVSEVIARQQPVAGDLRRLSSTYKIITNLERIADLAVNIGHKTIELQDEHYIKEFEFIPKMAGLARRGLQLSIQAYMDKDISRFEEVIALENDLDAVDNAAHAYWIKTIAEHPAATRQGMALTFVGSYLERIGDHATNIFETVYYIVTADYIDFNDLDEVKLKAKIS